jgi:hypothetical protein
MPAHYGVALIPDAHKNAMNVVYALWKNENPAASENLSQPANVSGDINDPATYWFGGRLYSDADLVVIQDMPNNMPSASWPVAGVSGNVSLVQAQAAAAALIVNVTTQDTYTTPQAAATLAAALGGLGLKKAEDPEE